jgi:hypothetical protein
MLARIPRQPRMRRGVLVQHHAHHGTARPFLAVGRALRRRLNQTGAMQVNLGHRVAQRIVVPLAQMFVEVLDRETAIKVAIQPQHPLDLRHRRPAQRRSQTTIRQTFQTAAAMAVTPAPKRPLADPKQLRSLHLAQLRPLRAVKNVRETHKPYSLVNPSPIHQNLHSWRPNEPDTSRATKTGQITS